MPTPYPVKFKLPLEFLTLQDWNNFVNNLLFINQYGSAQLLKYYQNGNFRNINDVIAEYLYVSTLKIKGYNVLHNLSEPLAYTFGEGKQQPFQSMANRPSFQLKTVVLPTLNFQIQLKPLAKQLELLIPRLTSKIATPQFIAGTQFQFSGTANVQTLIEDYLDPSYLQTWREIIIQNLGTSAVQINNSIYLMPKNCLKITASSPSEIQLTAQTPTLLSEEIEFITTQTQQYITVYTITITNNQADPTPSPFQQLLNLNLSSILSSSSQLLNLQFCLDSQCNTPLYAWIEQNNLSNAYIWINLPVSIPANSSITIYMFVRNSIQYPYTGIAPYLTSTYAQYDNGENVFNFYDNFAGTTLSSKWTQGIGSGGSITVNNGLTISSTTNYDTFVQSVPTFSVPIILESYVTAPTPTTNYERASIFIGTGSTTNENVVSYGYYFNNAYVNGQTWRIGTSSVSIDVGTTIALNGILGGYWIASGNEQLYYNYTQQLTWNDTSQTPQATTVGLAVAGVSGGYSATFKWARVRTYPPNGVMPSNSQPQKTIILVS